MELTFTIKDKLTEDEMTFLATNMTKVMDKSIKVINKAREQGLIDTMDNLKTVSDLFK